MPNQAGIVTNKAKCWENKLSSTEGFFRKSTFCTLTDEKPGIDRHWVMPEIFLLNGTFTMLEMTAFCKTLFSIPCIGAKVPL